MTDRRKALHNLACFLADDIMEATDEEILAEAVEDGVDLDEVAERCKAIFDKAVADLKAARSSEATR